MTSQSAELSIDLSSEDIKPSSPIMNRNRPSMIIEIDSDSQADQSSSSSDAKLASASESSSCCSKNEFEEKNEEEEEEDHEKDALKFLEKFYDSNFKAHKIMKTRDYTTQKVWNVFFDKIYDIAYVSLATIKRTNKREVVNETDFITEDGIQEGLKNEFEAIQIFSMYEVEFKLQLQIYDVKEMTDGKDSVSIDS
jgi:hypothetical protein